MEYCYIAVLTPFEDCTGYMAEVPSVSGCVTSGKDFYDAVDMIEDALAGCLCVLEDHGVPIPPETTNLDAYASPCEKKLVFIEVDTDEYRRKTENAENVSRS